jgi:uncharacterized Zn finger protein (UPF0148 family)
MEKKQCSVMIHKADGTWAGGYYQCKRAATVERNGKPYCSTHDPEAKAAKQAERDSKMREEWYANFKHRIERKAAEEVYAMMKQTNPEYVREVLKRVVADQFNSEEKRRMLAELGAEEETDGKA